MRSSDTAAAGHDRLAVLMCRRFPTLFHGNQGKACKGTLIALRAPLTPAKFQDENDDNEPEDELEGIVQLKESVVNADRTDEHQ